MPARFGAAASGGREGYWIAGGDEDSRELVPDGNGRLGRLLVIVQLLREAVIREPLLIVSPWFEQRRDAYQDALLQLSCDGAWDAWIGFFAEGVAASATESQTKVERLVELREELRTKVREAGRRGVSERLAADLVGVPFVTRADVATRYGVSGQTAINAISALVDLEILAPAFRGRRGAQVFGAAEIVKVWLATESRSRRR